jgi:ketol-acid reductoisomerase
MKVHADLIGKTVGILGYTEDGMKFAKTLRSEGINVVIGLREIDSMWPQAEKDGFQVLNLWNAVSISDIIQVW